VSNPRVVGGHDVSIEEVPYQVRHSATEPRRTDFWLRVAYTWLRELRVPSTDQMNTKWLKCDESETLGGTELSVT
jgi:hypothetical protein